MLNGLISSLNGINPDELQINRLIKRIQESKFKEVIIAVKQCIEGEMTALYIKNILGDMNIKVTRIASGIPIGADMEYIDSLTLEKAIDNCDDDDFRRNGLVLAYLTKFKQICNHPFHKTNHNIFLLLLYLSLFLHDLLFF